jgi:hypothetical protein
MTLEYRDIEVMIRRGLEQYLSVCVLALCLKWLTSYYSDYPTLLQILLNLAVNQTIQIEQIRNGTRSASGRAS